MESKEEKMRKLSMKLAEDLEAAYWQDLAERHAIRAFLYKLGFAISVGLNAAWWLM